MGTQAPQPLNPGSVSVLSDKGIIAMVDMACELLAIQNIWALFTHLWQLYHVSNGFYGIVGLNQVAD